MASPQLTEPGNLPPAPGFADTTVRQVVRVTLAGRKLRVRLSNGFGTVPLTFTGAHVALCPRRPIPLLGVLVVANLVWATVCLRWAILYFSTATVFGLLHLIGEGVYVAALASLEWRWREVLSYK